MINVAIVGATGYTGYELIKILENHKEVNISLVTSTTSSGQYLNEHYSDLKKQYLLEEYSIKTILERKIDLVFLAVPHGKAGLYVSEIVGNNVKVIDLSADFRFNHVEIYERKYPKHPTPNLCKQAIYGLSEINRAIIKSANLIGNPGCYVTSVLLPLMPVKDKIFNIIVDSKSGVSGAGVKVKEDMQNFIDNLDFKAYSVSSHRHQVEIEYYLNNEIEFVPHLLPINRGILSTIYFNSELTFLELDNTLSNFYKNDIFVKVLTDNEPKISDVVNTNNCFFKLYKGSKENTFIIVSVIDNLLKGASGQAVQNMNIIYSFSETEGLLI
jgi:N-acetyl-gamma-glutamyl-phosphate reductase